MILCFLFFPRVDVILSFIKNFDIEVKTRLQNLIKVSLMSS